MIGRVVFPDGVIVLFVWAMSRLLVHPRNPWQVLDWPNARSLHGRPVPRMGGLAVGCGVLLGAAWEGGRPSLPLIVVYGALALVALVSWYDDKAQLSAGVRLLAHGLAALVVAFVYLRWPTALLPGLHVLVDGSWGAVLMAVFLVWATNLYNFMDGMDGFAGGMAVCGFTMLAVLGYRAHDTGFFEAALVVASAALGFTFSNFPPAILFMGDLGAATLGFGAGIMVLVGSQRGDFPIWIGLVIFSPFWVDATVTLVRRIARGESPTVAHREHYYQRLVRLGFGHRRTVLGEYALMVVCGGAAYAALGRPIGQQWAILLSLAALYGLLAALVARWERYEEGDGKAVH